MQRRQPTVEDIADLQLDFSEAVATNVSLARLSHWQIGGTADAIVRPRSVDELRRLRCWLDGRGLQHVVIGATTNLLFADEGVRAVIVQLADAFCESTVQESTLTVGAASWVPGVARLAMRHGLSGIEHTCGIPGQLGGLVVMNGGSMRRGIGEHVVSVQSVTADGQLVERTRAACGFAYRESIYQEVDEVITSAQLGGFTVRESSSIRADMLAILASRSRKFPRKFPNCGSVFVSNPAMYADYGPPGVILEKLGFKGRQIGGAQFSPLHANFINNIGDARAADVLALIHEAKSAVEKETGYAMAVEARYMTPDGLLAPAG